MAAMGSSSSFVVLPCVWIWLAVLLSCLATCTAVDMSRFYVTLDGVMGGRSSGAVQTTQQGHLLFSGNINVLGGGFANIRTSIPTANFANSEGLVIEYVPRLQGEGDHGVSPLGVQVQVSDGRCACPKIAAFGLAPGAANGQKATAVVPTAAWENGKNQGWRSCSCDTDVTRITSIYLYVLFQEGSFQMELVNLRLLGWNSLGCGACLLGGTFDR